MLTRFRADGRTITVSLQKEDREGIAYEFNSLKLRGLRIPLFLYLLLALL